MFDMFPPKQQVLVKPRGPSALLPLLGRTKCLTSHSRVGAASLQCKLLGKPLFASVGVGSSA
jgi:hypothetical protein